MTLQDTGFFLSFFLSSEAVKTTLLILSLEEGGWVYPLWTKTAKKYFTASLNNYEYKSCES